MKVLKRVRAKTHLLIKTIVYPCYNVLSRLDMFFSLRIGTRFMTSDLYHIFKIFHLKKKSFIIKFIGFDHHQLRIVAHCHVYFLKTSLWHKTYCCTIVLRLFSFLFRSFQYLLYACFKAMDPEALKYIRKKNRIDVDLIQSPFSHNLHVRVLNCPFLR